MAGVLGRAFVQVFADLSKFSPGLREEIKKSLDENTKGMKFDELDKSAEKAGESAADEVGKGVDKKIKGKMEEEGKKGGNSFGKGFAAAMSGIGTAFLPVLISLGVEAAGALLPAIVALTATLPAAIVTAVSAMAVLKLATQGVGAAIKSSFDPKNAVAFQAAMAKLAPSARSFVKEVQGLHPAFKQLQVDVQQVFFAQLQGVLTKVANTLLPTLRRGLILISADLGKMGANLLRAFGSGKQDLASIFIAAHEAIKPFIPLVGELARVFLTIGAAAGPLFAQLSGGFAGLIKQFIDFINVESTHGGLSQFFSDAVTVLKQFGTILGGVFGLVMQILGALQDVGGQGLGTIGTLVTMLNNLFASAEGHQALVGIFTLLNVALTSLSTILAPLLPAVAQLATEFSGKLASALIAVTPALAAITTFLGQHPGLIAAAVTAWGVYRGALMAVAVAEAIVDALDPVTWIVLALAAIAAGAYLIYKNWGAVVAAVKTAGDAIKNFFSGIWNWIQTVGKDIGNWFTVTLPNFFASLPGRIWAVLSAIPGLLWRLFLDALHLAGEAIGIGVGLIIASLIKTPDLVWNAIKGIGHLFVDLWHLALSAGKTVLEAGIAVVIFTFTQLPGKIAGFVGRLPGIIGGAFRTAWNNAKDFVRNGANDIVSFIQKLPGRVAGFMRNVGGDILGGLKSGIDSVISGFNSGIDRVGGFLHIGLPHIPLLAAGGLISAPTLAVVGEAGAEAVIPMSDPARAAAVARSTGLLDMLGSKTSAGPTMVKVYLGTREITDILDVRIDHKLNDQAAELAYGTR